MEVTAPWSSAVLAQGTNCQLGLLFSGMPLLSICLYPTSQNKTSKIEQEGEIWHQLVPHFANAPCTFLSMERQTLGQ